MDAPKNRFERNTPILASLFLLTLPLVPTAACSAQDDLASQGNTDSDDEAFRRRRSHRDAGPAEPVEAGTTTPPVTPTTDPAPPPPNPPTNSPAPTGTPVAVHGDLSVKGNHIIDKSGQPALLRGMSLGWSNYWPKYWNASVVDWLVDDFKVDVIRAAMGVEPDNGQIKGYLSDATAETKLVTTVVDEAIKRGAYVIIDWHEENAPKHTDKAKAFFSDMAARYGSQPNVIYEIFNEPVNYPWATIRSYAESVIAAIRAKDPNNLIIVGTPNWSSDMEAPITNPLTGPNIAYTFHFYAQTHKDRGPVTRAMAAGIPVFVTEWGTGDASGYGTIDTVSTQAWLDFLEANKISWVNWSISDVSGQACSALMPNASSTGQWATSALSTDGKLIRSKLRTYAGATP